MVFVLIARQCTARCSQRVAPQFFQVYTYCIYGIYTPLFRGAARCKQRAVRYSPMRTNSLLTRCKQRAVRYSPMRTNSLLTRCKQRAVRYSPMRTNSLPTRCKQRAVHCLSMRTNSLLTSSHPKPTDPARDPATTRAPPSSKEPAKPSGG